MPPDAKPDTPAPPALPTRCDAVLTPPGYADVPGGDAYALADKLVREFGPLLGCPPGSGKVLRYSIQPGDIVFARTDPAATLMYPIGHPLEKEHRYDWHQRPDGVRLGVLKPDPTAEPQA